jgi:hypothetical protein
MTEDRLWARKLLSYIVSIYRSILSLHSRWCRCGLYTYSQWAQYTCHEMRKVMNHSKSYHPIEARNIHCKKKLFTYHWDQAERFYAKDYSPLEGFYYFYGYRNPLISEYLKKWTRYSGADTGIYHAFSYIVSLYIPLIYHQWIRESFW